MIRLSRRRYGGKYEKREKSIDPDEIFIDSSNLPNFDVHQFEGRLEKAITRRSLFILGGVFCLIFAVFLFRTWSLQIKDGAFYLKKSENNRLRNSLIFAKRGVIYDRNGTKLAWNIENPEPNSFNLRKYSTLNGLSHILGYVKYPSKDKYGFYYSDSFSGKDGVEEYYNDILSGKNGKRIVEVNALGEIQSENIVHKPTDGSDLKLTIDADLQSEVHRAISNLAKQIGFTGGAGILMDVNTGEVLALTNYPEYSSQILTDGQDIDTINSYRNNKSNPFLNRAIHGLYTPGSTVKPFMAFAALNEKIIDPLKNILSTGSISIPNPYDKDRPSVFNDWKAHGYVDMRKALAVSSDVYFYEIGGGFEDQIGLGINRIDKYMQLFGFGSPLPTSFFSGPAGTIPNPEWKAKSFPGDIWRVGNTYHTSIGQYGFQVTAIQLARSVAAIANGGKLLEPQILLFQDNRPVINTTYTDLDLDQKNLEVIKEGMFDGVVKDYGTVKGLYSSDYTVAAKTGTAELDSAKRYINSLISGFFPYENPKYVFVIVMEKGLYANTAGSVAVMRQIMDWMVINRPEYLK